MAGIQLPNCTSGTVGTGSGGGTTGGGTNNVATSYSDIELVCARIAGGAPEAIREVIVRNSSSHTIEQIIYENVITGTVIANASVQLVDAVDCCATPDISVSKVAVPNGFAAGDTISYTITLTNNSNGPLTNVTVADPSITLTPPGPFNLVAGGVQAVTGTYTITAADVTAGSISNTAIVSATDAGGQNIGPFTANALTNIVVADPPGQLTVAKTSAVAGVGTAGDVVTYTVVIDNPGTVDVSNISATDALVTLTPAGPYTIVAGTNITLTGTYTITAGDVTAGTIDNTVNISGSDTNGDPVTATASNTVTTVAPSMTLTKTGAVNNVPDPNPDFITYNFTITNTGNVPLTNVVLSDPKIPNASMTPSGPFDLAVGATGVRGVIADYTPTAAEFAAGVVINTSSVSSNEGATAVSGPVSINVTPPITNAAPVSTGFADQSNPVGVPISYPVGATFTDPNGDTMAFSATGLPASLTINLVTGEITGTIDATAVSNVTVIADDGNGGVTPITFTITGTNTPVTPTGIIPDQTSTAGVAITPLATAGNFNEPDVGQVLVYSAVNLPAGLTIDPATGIISGTPTAVAPLPVTVSVTAEDPAGATGTTTFDWSVVASNAAPVTTGTPIPDVSFLENETISIVPVGVVAAFSDPDGDTLTYSATGLPAGTVMNLNGSVTGTITAPVGTYPITVTADDGRGGTVASTFNFVVSPNQVPVAANPIPNVNLNETDVANIDVTVATFSDPEGHTPLTYQATGLPAGLNIDSTTGIITGTPTGGTGGLDPTGTDYTVNVTATDSRGGVSTPTSFTINVVDETPFVGNTTAVTFDLNDSQLWDAANPNPGTTIISTTSASPIDSATFLNAGGVNGLTLTITATNNNPSFFPTTISVTANGSLSVAGLLAADMAIEYAFSGPVTLTNIPNGAAVSNVSANVGDTVTSFTFDYVGSGPSASGPLQGSVALVVVPTLFEQHTGVNFDIGSQFADAEDANSALTFTGTGLPGGLTMTTDGRIVGDVGAGTSGNYAVQVTATDTAGNATTQTLEILVRVGSENFTLDFNDFTSWNPANTAPPNPVASSGNATWSLQDIGGITGLGLDIEVSAGASSIDLVPQTNGRLLIRSNQTIASGPIEARYVFSEPVWTGNGAPSVAMGSRNEIGGTGVVGNGTSIPVGLNLASNGSAQITESSAVTEIILGWQTTQTNEGIDFGGAPAVVNGTPLILTRVIPGTIPWTP